MKRSDWIKKNQESTDVELINECKSTSSGFHPISISNLQSVRQVYSGCYFITKYSSQPMIYRSACSDSQSDAPKLNNWQDWADGGFRAQMLRTLTRQIWFCLRAVDFDQHIRPFSMLFSRKRWETSGNDIWAKNTTPVSTFPDQICVSVQWEIDPSAISSDLNFTCMKCWAWHALSSTQLDCLFPTASQTSLDCFLT